MRARVIAVLSCLVVANMGTVGAVLFSALQPAAAIPAANGSPANGSQPTEIAIGGYGTDGVRIAAFAPAPQAAPSSQASPTPSVPTVRRVASMVGPTFISGTPAIDALYVTSETSGANTNLFAITRAGKVLSSVNSGGLLPVRSAVSGNRLAVANYDGSVALFSLAANGSITKTLALIIRNI